jgi:hypothetical protein
VILFLFLKISENKFASNYKTICLSCIKFVHGANHDLGRNEILNLFRQLLQQVQPRTWLVVGNFRSNLGNLILAFRLKSTQYKQE